MPAMRVYEATKTIKVKVHANNALDAHVIAEKAFAEKRDVNGQKIEDVKDPNWGFVDSSGIQDVSTNVVRTDI